MSKPITLGFPARMVIDDHCDGCGSEARGRIGVAFGAQKPVLCERCLAVAMLRLEGIGGVPSDPVDTQKGDPVIAEDPPVVLSTGPLPGWVTIALDRHEGGRWIAMAPGLLETAVYGKDPNEAVTKLIELTKNMLAQW